MRETKNSWRYAIYILFLAAIIYGLFLWYSSENSQRIREQNLTYAMDYAIQSVNHVHDEFDNALYQIRSDAYFVTETLTQAYISQELLKKLENKSVFDAIRFTDAKGITYASDGNTTDSSDRDFFVKGMKGESGISVILESRITGNAMINFYTPLYYKGEIIGVLRGVYSAEKYLHDMLVTSYFGRTADVYLCTREGMVIATSSNGEYDRPLLDILYEDGVIDAVTAERAWGIIHKGRGEGAFICDERSTADNLCLLSIPKCDYILIQAFPKSVTQSMVRAANYNGILLQMALIILFSICMLVFGLRAKRGRVGLEKENMDMSYVTSSVNTLFTYFILVDLQDNTYRYLNGAKPRRIDFPESGSYDELVPYICTFLADKEDVQGVKEHLERNAIVRDLGESISSLQYEYKVLYNEIPEWMQCSIISLERKDNKVSKVMFLWQNVTSLKEKEQRTQNEVSMVNRKAERYVEATLTDAFCTYECNLTHDRIESVSISQYNNLIEKQLGIDVSKELGQLDGKTICHATVWFDSWRRFVSEEYLEEYDRWSRVTHFLECFSQGEREVEVEYWTKEYNNKVYCIRLSCFMSEDDETGDIIGLIVAKEITGQVREQRQQMQALQEALYQAQCANSAKSTFLSNMSHDIHTPMNAIIGYTNMAVNHLDNQKRVEMCLQKVLSSSSHLLNLINEILDMSYIENGNMQMKEQECSLPEVIRDVFNIIQPQIKVKNMQLFTSTIHVVNEDIIADPLKLCQVFVNLLGNAVKYTPAGGKITFSIVQRAAFGDEFGDYTFTVQDNGIGMSQEFLAHIFEPFEREHTVTKSGIKGSGLGMTVTKHIVDMMGGTIEVRSKKGEGSEFRVEFKLKLQHPAKNEIQIKDLANRRVLVVDDDLDSCDSISRMLRQLGMMAEWIPSGKEAIARVESSYKMETPYDVYFIKWHMPEMSGIEITEKIREVTDSKVPIIILTAYDWTDIEQEAKEAGATAFCAKPLFMSNLKSALLLAFHPEEYEKDNADKIKVDFKSKRVLLVDDNEMNREIAESVLEEAGFVVETASDGTDAVEMVERSEEYYYDVILTDIQMPIMDGYEEAKAIRAMPRKDVQDMPIIAISANFLEEDRKRALMSGMNAWLDKPLYVEAFIEALEKFLIKSS